MLLNNVEKNNSGCHFHAGVVILNTPLMLGMGQTNDLRLIRLLV